MRAGTTSPIGAMPTTPASGRAHTAGSRFPHHSRESWNLGLRHPAMVQQSGSSLPAAIARRSRGRNVSNATATARSNKWHCSPRARARDAADGPAADRRHRCRPVRSFAPASCWRTHSSRQCSGRRSKKATSNGAATVAGRDIGGAAAAGCAVGCNRPLGVGQSRLPYSQSIPLEAHCERPPHPAGFPPPACSPGPNDGFSVRTVPSVSTMTALPGSIERTMKPFNAPSLPPRWVSRSRPTGRSPCCRTAR